MQSYHLVALIFYFVPAQKLLNQNNAFGTHFNLINCSFKKEKFQRLCFDSNTIAKIKLSTKIAVYVVIAVSLCKYLITLV